MTETYILTVFDLKDEKSSTVHKNIQLDEACSLMRKATTHCILEKSDTKEVVFIKEA